MGTKVVPIYQTLVLAYLEEQLYNRLEKDFNQQFSQYIKENFKTMVINNGGKIQTDIFYKPTDSKQYLLYTYCHPKHTRISIPYNLARRLKKYSVQRVYFEQPLR